MDDVSWEDREDGRWIWLEGQLDYDGCERIAEPFREAAAGARGQLVVDLSRVSFVSSQGIRMMLDACNRGEERGTRMFLYGLAPHVHKVFATTGVFRKIPEWTG